MQAHGLPVRLLMGVVSKPELNGQRVHVIAGDGDRGRVRVRLFDSREDISVKRDCLLDPVDLRGEAGPGEQVEREEQQHTEEEEEERAETPTVEERQQQQRRQIEHPRQQDSAQQDEEQDQQDRKSPSKIRRERAARCALRVGTQATGAKRKKGRERGKRERGKKAKGTSSKQKPKCRAKRRKY